MQESVTYFFAANSCSSFWKSNTFFECQTSAESLTPVSSQMFDTEESVQHRRGSRGVLSFSLMSDTFFECQTFFSKAGVSVPEEDSRRFGAGKNERCPILKQSIGHRLIENSGRRLHLSRKLIEQS